MKIALTIVALSLAGAAQTAPVALPLGRTFLSDIGRYQISYQSYGGKTTTMPTSWAGHFEAVSGISYMPAEKLLGRNAILLHSPWRVPPGKVWIDYRILLPRTRAITLSFGVAMKPDMLTPERSDGVTFSCFVDSGRGFEKQMRHHREKQGWKDYRFDLSDLAGKTIVLRLQTEPGPDNNASFDYSYFGNACIEAGASGTALSETVATLMARPAIKATVHTDLTAAANLPARGVTPSNLLPGSNRIEADGDAWQLIYEGADCRIVYRYLPQTGTLDDITVRVDGNPPFRPAGGGGIRFPGQGQPRIGSTRREADNILTNLTCLVDGESATAQWRFGIAGKALLIGIRGADPVFTGVSLGNVADAALRRKLAVPYLEGTIDYLPGDYLYVARRFDWTVTNASTCARGEATYAPKTDGSRNLVSESGYIAISPHVAEVLPNLPHPPSPHLALLAPRIMLDVWGHHRDGTFQGDALTLRHLKDNGVDHLAIIQHVWQRFGYDVKLPDHIPAHPDMGGDAGMTEFGKVANEYGYIWSVHENYIDLYPDAPSYDPSARVLRSDGTPSPAWLNRGTGIQSYGLKCNRALGFARRNAPEIHRRYGTTAAYLDVHTCVPPWHQLDHEAGQPNAAMCRAKVVSDTALFTYMRETHGGPLFGEGFYHFYWAGACDGVEAQVTGGEDHRPFLEFDLLKIHPQMVNHGMGYYERWFRRGYSHVPGVDSCAPFQIDKYRAQEIAYGHAGFIGNLATANIQWVAKEHNLMHPIQRLYGTAKATRIDYEVAGRLVPGSVALATNRLERQHVTYDSGLRVWVNWSTEPWSVQKHVLPQWGFLARGPDTEVWTALTAAGIADVARCPEYVFVDSRTAFTMPYLKRGMAIEPRLRSLALLEDHTIEITYEWHVNEAPPADAVAFVHFVNDQSSDREDMIVAQNDHGFPKPASQWRPGEVIIDGPHTVELPEHADRYEILIGLYNARGRFQLKGADREGRRYLIGLFTIQDGKLLPGDLKAEVARYEKGVKPADYTRHMNPVGTWVDVGDVATDGSVKVTRGRKQLLVYPYPRGRRFTVELDPIQCGLDSVAVRVQALKALSDEVLSPVPIVTSGDRIRFEVGHEGAGRYLVAPRN